MTKTTEYLNRLKKLCESATEGPWEWVGSDLWGKDNDEVLNFDCYTSFGLSGASPILESTDENRAFIAQSRELVPKLIEALEAATDAFRRLERNNWNGIGPDGLTDGQRVSEFTLKEIEAILCEQGESDGDDETEG